jgi:thermostable 8-oxoguanine DNA glycosylase
MTEDTSEDEAFNFQNLVGQELTEAEKEELKEYAIYCGYRPGALLFDGIDDERLGCI